MDISAPESHGILHELSDAECWRLLESHDLGRVAYVEHGSPVILPMNYVAEDGLLWFATASYNQLAVHIPGQRIAFEIDASDHTQHSGWSVLVQGRASHVMPGKEFAGPTPTRPTPWPDGTRTMLFCLTPTEVTGRSIPAA